MKLSLRGKAVTVITLAGLLIGAVAIILSYVVYANTMDEHYQKKAIELAQSAIAMLDNEKIHYYAMTGEQDEEYDAQRDILLRLLDANENALYLYILTTENGVGDVVEGAQGYDIMDTDPDVVCPDPNVIYKSVSEGVNDVYISNTDAYGWLCTALVWMYDSDGRGYACMNVDISMNDVMADRMDFLRMVIIAVVIAVACACALLTMLVNRYIIHPIKAVSGAATRYISDRRSGTGIQNTESSSQDSGADLENNGPSTIARLSIHTGDEIEGLAEAIQTMEREINDYIHDLTTVTAEKERIGAELDVAKHIQASMLPSIFPAFPDRPEFDIYASMTPAKEVGGDFYDFFLIDNDHLAMVMADVSGKGVPAALFMMISKTLLKSAAQSGLSPKAVLEKVNNQLCENNDAEMFVTVWLGILEISTGKMTCANAGHEYPAIKRAGGAFELFKDKHGFVLAGMEGARYREYELELHPGDMLYVYTDGVAEATNAQNELYGTGRMLSALNRLKDQPCQALLHGIKADIDAFVGDAPQFDDITMLCLKLNGAGQDETGLHLKVKPGLEELETVTVSLERFLEGADVPMKVMTQINIAVDEIFSNIARYSGASAAEIRCAVQGGRITLVFTDDGSPYDPTHTPDPDVTLSAEERDIGGLGIYMVKKSMDSVTYEQQDGRNVLTLTKSWQ